MTASVTSIATHNHQQPAQPELASVASVDAQGRVEQVTLLTTDNVQEISGQAKHISFAAIGDTVLVQNTAQGLIIIAQLAKPSDSPSAHISDNNGHVNVKGAKSVTLSTRKGSIEVFDDGTIVLDATELNATSERDLSIAGWPIRLN